MTVSEEPTPLPGRRAFALGYVQPEHHAAPAGKSFSQRLLLLHIDDDAPLVVTATGYGLQTAHLLDEVTVTAGGNQLAVEHRFFGTSVAEPPDWSRLDIAEAAADWHRVIAALRTVYRGRVLTAGGSKGGVASLAHRRFFPSDAAGTVAMASPISQGAPDGRYPAFVAAIGGTTAAQCREDLRRVQRELLLARPAMRARMTASPLGFTRLGVDKALEDAVLELPFLFWQFGRISRCVLIPEEGAGDDELFAFFEDTVILYNFSDEGIGALRGFYVQTANQLGWPAHEEAHLADLLMFPGGDRAGAYVPEIDTGWDGGAAMSDLVDWMQTEGRQLLLVYGERDPWTAGAPSLGAAVDSLRLVAPGANHNVRIADLDESGRVAAFNAIRRWAGVD